MFSKTAGKHSERLAVADGGTFEFGDTRLWFSEPVFHGIRNTFLGWVLMTTIDYGEERVMFASDVEGPMYNIDYGGERVMFASDVEGPMYNPTVEMILGEAPDLLIIGGPPLYLAGFKVVPEEGKQSFGVSQERAL